MIPFRGDQFDHFNHGLPINRPMMLIPQQQQPHLIQHLPSSFAFGAPAPNFHQPYHGNLRMPQQQQQQQQQFIFIPHGPHTQQLWMGPSPSLPPAPTPTFIPSPPGAFHHAQPSYPPPPPQPSFSGGNGIPQPSFSGGSAMSQPLLGAGTGIPQPPFSGGTATLKRKSHYLDESDFNGPSNFDHEHTSLMNMPTLSFASGQQQHHYRPANPRFIDHNAARSRFSSGTRSQFPNSDEPFGNAMPNPHRSNNGRSVYNPPPQPPLPTHQAPQQQALTSQLFQKHQLIPIDTLLKEPGRSQRPAQIIIILRGLPGSGKSYVADLIKTEEELQSKGQNKPKILSIDNYHVTENRQETKDPKTGKITKTSVMEYEYDAQMDVTYRRSLSKLVRKSIDDRFFPFLIVDQNNEQTEHFRDIVEYAEANQFQVYFIELNSDVPLCAQRNIHKRSLADIEQIRQRWESLPLRYDILDIRSMLQSDAIDEVEMDDAPMATANENENEQEQKEEEDEQEESQITKKSKWEAMMETNPDRLDGLYQRRTSSTTRSSSPIEKRLNSTTMMLIDETPSESSASLQSRKKKVRWADIEEDVLYQHKRAVGFVVGQTEQDWQRMSDAYDPTQKLNQYKYI